MRGTLRNAVGSLTDIAIAAFGLALLARGLVVAGGLLLLVAGVDLSGRLGVLPFARKGALTGRQRGDLIWGVVLALIGAAILVEELVVVVNGRLEGRHLLATVIGLLALSGSLVFFVRLLRSRH